MRLHERDEVGRADFLLPLGQHDQVDRQPAVGGQQRLRGLHVQEKLSLVVGGTARVDAPVAHVRLEGGSRPQLQRLGGLDVVVAVHQHGGGVLPRSAPFAEHHRVARRLEDLRLQADVPHAVAQPAGGVARVPVVFGLGADGGNAQEVEEFRQKPLQVVGGESLRSRHIHPRMPQR